MACRLCGSHYANLLFVYLFVSVCWLVCVSGGRRRHDDVCLCVFARYVHTRLSACILSDGESILYHRVACSRTALYARASAGCCVRSAVGAPCSLRARCVSSPHLRFSQSCAGSFDLRTSWESVFGFFFHYYSDAVSACQLNPAAECQGSGVE